MSGKHIDTSKPTTTRGIAPRTVLHIDDDANDTELLRAATRKAGLEVSIQNVEDGDEAISYLAGVGIYGDRSRYPVPGLVLLDLKLPRVDGLAVLKWIRGQPALHKIPVVVLSGSDFKDHVHEALAEGANAYQVKPLGFDALVNLVKELSHAWIFARAASGS